MEYKIIINDGKTIIHDINFSAIKKLSNIKNFHYLIHGVPCSIPRLQYCFFYLLVFF
jgi:hypothetical protein